ncbi:MAG: hypothetical protein JO111_18480 [Caulobacteraceae bacterium]|nr:hypothetical protein [Caulobacteraceae bacterium]
MSVDAYAVLGVSPESEDVVVRAAYRALMQKYTSLTRLDAPDDDQRAREVQAAYDRVAAARRAAAASPPLFRPVLVEPAGKPIGSDPESSLDAVVPEPPPAFLSPATIEVANDLDTAPDRPQASATGLRLPRHPAAWIAGTGALALCGTVLATLWTPLHLSTVVPPAPATPALKVKLQHHRPAAVSLAKPLPCFVEGRPVGDLRLIDCAGRNGVASGSIESSMAPAAPVSPSLSLPPPTLPRSPPSAGPIPLGLALHTAPSPAPHEPVVLKAIPSKPVPARPAQVAHAAKPNPATHHPPSAKLASRAPAPAAEPVRPAHARPMPRAQARQDLGPPKNEVRHEAQVLWREAANATRRVLASALKGGSGQSELGDRFDDSASTVPPRPTPQKHGAEAANTPPARLEVARASVPAPAESSEVQAAPRPGPREAVAATRAFYQALTEGDDGRAVSLVVPEARDQGPLSAERIKRFSSGVKAPIRLTSIRPIDDSRVFVRYQYVSPSNRLCDGTADVATAPREGRVMISGIHATYDCHGE